MKGIVVLLLISIGPFCVDAEQRPRINGGRAANSTRNMPWIVSVKVKTDVRPYYCSGVIVYKRMVVTAAHCVCIRNITRITVWTGSASDYAPNKKKYLVDRIFRLPTYAAATCEKPRSDDMVFLITTQTIQYSSTTRNIGFELNQISNNTAAVYMGYGDDSEGKSGYLRYGNTRVYDCRRVGMLCSPRAINWLGQGDSGGPLVICRTGIHDCRLIGIHSATEDVLGTLGLNFFVSVHRYRKVFEIIQRYN